MSFELSDEYQQSYDKHILHPFPGGTGLGYYKKGLRYFNTFDGFGPDVKIVGVEDWFTLDLQGVTVVGATDLILRSNTSGALTVMCHKSKSCKTMRQQLPLALHQLYLNAMGAEKHFGHKPDTLCFNLFREGAVLSYPYEEAAREAACEWVLDTIDTISQDATYRANPSDFRCYYICSSREHCPVIR